MRRSIRWRLQAWYALVLVIVVTGFAGILFYRVRAGRFQEIDAGLEADALYLDANLRRFPPSPPPGREGLFPDRPPPGRAWPPPPPPPGPSRERLLAELTLPPRGPRAGSRDSAYTFFGVWRADGGLVKASQLPKDVAAPDLSVDPPRGRPRLSERGPYREAVMLGPRNTRILVGRSVERERAELRAFAWQLAGAGLALLAVGLVGGWVVSSRILRPVAAISATASAISATNLSERIDTSTVDRELEELARVLNAMFARLEAAFDRQARFTADASHELRTPLAVLCSHAELALTRPRTADEYRETIETCLRASRRMAALVEALLILARADAGKLDVVREPVKLKAVVEDGIALIRPLAEAAGVVVAADLDPAEVTGDPVRLAQVVANLLSNAVQYNRPGGEVRVRLGVSSATVVLSVADTGIGIPAADQPHVFERFYRVDKARSRASGGNGLGLAICQSIVEAHGGTIGFETKSGQGSTFWVRLPSRERGGTAAESDAPKVSCGPRTLPPA